MKDLEFLPIVIAVLLLLIFWKLSAISARLKERFPCCSVPEISKSLSAGIFQE
jgi:hypothetical protein